MDRKFTVTIQPLDEDLRLKISKEGILENTGADKLIKHFKKHLSSKYAYILVYSPLYRAEQALVSCFNQVKGESELAHLISEKIYKIRQTQDEYDLNNIIDADVNIL